MAYTWSSVQVVTVTNLHSLATTNIWKSGKLDLPDTSPDNLLRIWYYLALNAAPADQSMAHFRIAHGSEHSTEIWPANISETEEQITTLATKLDIRSALPPVKTHRWVTSQNNHMYGHFDVRNVSNDFQVLVDLSGPTLASSGSIIHYRMMYPA